MKNFKYIIVLFLLFAAGCNENTESIKETPSMNAGETDENQKKDDQLFASVGGQEITQEEMDYECFRAELQNALANEATQNFCPPEKTIISQIIELKAIDYLAKEKEVAATAEEVNIRIDKLKKDITSTPVFQEKVTEFGEEKFWKYEEQRYFTIINAEKVKEKLFEEEKAKHSYLDNETLKLNAKQNFDDLIVEAVGLVEPTIFYY